MLGEHAFPERIERLRLGADASFQRFGDFGWEGEGIEAACFVVTWVIANAETSTCRKCPLNVISARKNT